MLASPNYFTGVYNGSGAAAGIRNTSEAITHIFEEVNFSFLEFAKFC